MINTSEHILVILLSIALAVLLALSIAVAIYVIRLLQAANRLAAKAEALAERATDIGSMLSRFTASGTVIKLVKVAYDLARKRKRRSK